MYRLLLTLGFVVCVCGWEVHYEIQEFDSQNNYRYVHQLNHIELNDLLHMNISTLNAAYGHNLFDQSGSNPPCAGLGTTCFAINADRDKHPTHRTIRALNTSTEFTTGAIYSIFNVAFVVYSTDCVSHTTHYARYVFVFSNQVISTWRLQQIDTESDNLEFKRVIDACNNQTTLPRIALFDASDTDSRPTIDCNTQDPFAYPVVDLSYVANRSVPFTGHTQFAQTQLNGYSTTVLKEHYSQWYPVQDPAECNQKCLQTAGCQIATYYTSNSCQLHVYEYPIVIRAYVPNNDATTFLPHITNTPTTYVPLAEPTQINVRTCATCYDTHECTITINNNTSPVYDSTLGNNKACAVSSCTPHPNAPTTVRAGTSVVSQQYYEDLINDVDIQTALDATNPYSHHVDYGLHPPPCAGIANTRTCMPAIQYRWAPFRVISVPDNSAAFIPDSIYSVIPVLVVAITNDNVEIRQWIRFVFLHNSITGIWTLIRSEPDMAMTEAVNSGCFNSTAQPSLLLWPEQQTYSYGACETNKGFNYALNYVTPQTCSGPTGVAYALNTTSVAISCTPGCHAELRNTSVALAEGGSCACRNNSGYINPVVADPGLCPTVAASVICTIPAGCLRESDFLPVYHETFNGLSNRDAIAALTNSLGNLTAPEYLALAGNPQTQWFDTSWTIAWWDFEPFYVYDVVVNTSVCYQNPDASPFTGACAGVVGAGGQRYLYKLVPIMMYGYTYGVDQPYDNVGVATFLLTFAYDTNANSGWISVSTTVNDWVGLSFLGHYAIGNGRMPLTDDVSLNLNTGYCSNDTQLKCGYDVTTPMLLPDLILATTVNECGNYTATVDTSECDTDAAHRFINYDIQHAQFTPRVNYNLVSGSFSDFINDCIPQSMLRRMCPGKEVNLTTRGSNEYVRNLVRAELATPDEYAILVHIADAYSNNAYLLVEYLMHDSTTDEPLTGLILAGFELVRVEYGNHGNFTWGLVGIGNAYFVYNHPISGEGIPCVTETVTSTCLAPACGGMCYTYTYNNVTTIGLNMVQACANVEVFARNTNQSSACVSPLAADFVNIRSLGELFTPDVFIKWVVYITVPCVIAILSGIMLGMR